MTGVVTHQLAKTYPLQNGRRRALEPLSLSIEAGEFVCVLGPSGCGKSTLLNILSGLDKAYEGDVEFPSGPPRVGYVFQEARLLPWLKVKDNLRFVLDGDDGAERRIDRWLKRVGLSDNADDYPSQLSVGMQQRVALARALIIEPDLLLMDEPFSSLDELTAQSMRGELLDLWLELKSTVVFVTHNPLEAVYLGDRVLIMSAGPGRVISELKPDDTLPRPRDFEDPRLWQLSREAVRRLEAG